MSITRTPPRVQHAEYIGYDAIRWVMSINADELTHAEFRLLIWIAKFYNPTTHDCWPSRETLAEGTGLSLTGVSHILKTLREKGFVRVTSKGRRGRGRAPSNHYALEMDRGDVRSPLQGDVRSPLKNPATRWGQNFRGDVGSPKEITWS